MTNAQSSSEYLIWRGKARLIVGEKQYEVNCRVVLPPPRHDIQINTDNPFGFGAMGLQGKEELSIQIRGVAEPIDVFLIHCSVGTQGKDDLAFHLKRSPIWLVKSEELRTGRTALVNFAHYWMGAPANTRFELRARGWVSQVIPASDKTMAFAETMRDDRYQLTHQVEFAREDGSLFSRADADTFLEELSLFLSFCRGQWVATSFTVP